MLRWFGILALLFAPVVRMRIWRHPVWSALSFGAGMICFGLTSVLVVLGLIATSSLEPSLSLQALLGAAMYALAAIQFFFGAYELRGNERYRIAERLTVRESDHLALMARRED
jgi:hypothetical protein